MSFNFNEMEIFGLLIPKARRFDDGEILHLTKVRVFYMIKMEEEEEYRLYIIHAYVNR